MVFGLSCFESQVDIYFDMCIYNYPIEISITKHIWFSILISLIRANDIDGLINMELSFHRAKGQMDF